MITGVVMEIERTSVESGLNYPSPVSGGRCPFRSLLSLKRVEL